MYVNPELVLQAVLIAFLVVIGGLLAWLLILAIGILSRTLRVMQAAESLITKVDEYISKPIGAMAEIVDQVGPIIRFLAARRTSRRSRDDD